jgi:hypothetical protein
VATTLVTLSSKEKIMFGSEANIPSFGLGVGASTLEPGTCQLLSQRISIHCCSVKRKIVSFIWLSSCVVPPYYFIFVDFVQSLESLKGEELLQLMQSFLSKGVTACQKGFERIVSDAKASLEYKKLLEEDNRKLQDENTRLEMQSRQLSDRVKT